MKLVNGVGVNDSDYPVTPTINGKQVWCPYYRVWKGMMDRAYGKHSGRRTYVSVSVHNDWHRFSQFRSWMTTQDWEGKELDKDLLVKGNDVYSADTCVFVSNAVNLFLTDCANSRGDLPIGVSFYKRTGRYHSKISIDGKKVKHLGYFNTPTEAHDAYRKAKYQQALILAESQTNLAIASALISRYALHD